MIILNPKFDPSKHKFIDMFFGEFEDKSIKKMESFLSIYEPFILRADPLIRMKLKSKDKRICMFCGKSMHSKSKTTFKNRAHLIPQLLGNKNLINDKECDSCNRIFSKYENDLANFIGPYRTLSLAQWKNGIPKYKSQDGIIVLEKYRTYENEMALKIVNNQSNGDYFRDDPDKKILTFNIPKKNYKPINVFKALIKIGYSLLPEEDLRLHSGTLRFLLGTETDEQMLGNPFFYLLSSIIPSRPFGRFYFVIGFKKRSYFSTTNYPSFTFVIYFQNMFYQFFMPFYQNDFAIFDNSDNIVLRRMEPLIDKKYLNEFGKHRTFIHNLSSNLDVNGEIEKVVMGYKNRKKIVE